MPEDPSNVLFSCKCGRTEVTSWTRPPACYGCRVCRTNLTEGGHLSAHHLPHEYYNEEMVFTEDGSITKTVSVCKWCGRIENSLDPISYIL